MYNVLVLDMQPIAPPVGGGRLRLLGLYHDLGKDFPTTYIGTYDWPGEELRDHRLSETLREVDIPLSESHFSACRELQARLGGKTIIDVTFHRLGHLSQDYTTYVKSAVRSADVIIFSHPWVYPLVKEELDITRQSIIYDSQNVEGYLRYTLLDDGTLGTEIVKEVIRIEHELCQISSLVFTCSHEDRELFNRLYDIPFDKMRVVPNGAFTDEIKPVRQAEKETIKQKLGIAGKKAAIFIGSNYQPNTEAATYIIGSLAPKLADVVFIIAGGVGDGIEKRSLQHLSNVVITGFISDKDKLLYLGASDIALNPMFGGSGTNIKMFDVMAAGLPVLSTGIGARGIDLGTYDAVKICDRDSFAESIQSVFQDNATLEKMAVSARRVVEEKYSWEKISGTVGMMINRFAIRRSFKRPAFSVIVPSYNRQNNLTELAKTLAQQDYREFEVIIVDQSSARWAHADTDFGLDIIYIHTDIKGAVKARNTAALLARGEILAFTDDDCIPSRSWLANAKCIFNQSDAIGIEGLIKSDKLNDPDYRPVTNEGFPGIGFMTANLFLKTEIFNRINGFDECFDNPHFREDTDLAWRALEYGEIPFSNDVVVFHPPHPRSIERESLAERTSFFEKDALLLKKHPRRYMELFRREDHWKKTPGFWDHFLRGAHKYNVDVSKYEVCNYYREMHPADLLSARKPAIAEDDVGWKSSQMSTIIGDLVGSDNVMLSSVIPSEIAANLSSSSLIVGEVRKVIGEKTHGDYFDSSSERYKQYFSIAKTYLEKGATILDVGNAPGHVGIGLYLLGMKVKGLNLNDSWIDTYPSPEWLKTFNVISHDIEKDRLPFAENSFDAIFFTEVLEHIAIKNPVEVLSDFRRVLKDGGLLVLSTPNICNISNLYALANGKNVFWPTDKFYGSLDRHNREFTPVEVREVVVNSGFKNIAIYGFSCWSNWNSEGAEFANKSIEKFGDKHPLMRNTIMVLAYKSP